VDYLPAWRKSSPSHFNIVLSRSSLLRFKYNTDLETSQFCTFRAAPFGCAPCLLGRKHSATRSAFTPSIIFPPPTSNHPYSCTLPVQHFHSCIRYSVNREHGRMPVRSIDPRSRLDSCIDLSHPRNHSGALSLPCLMILRTIGIGLPFRTCFSPPIGIRLLAMQLSATNQRNQYQHTDS